MLVVNKTVYFIIEIVCFVSVGRRQDSNKKTDKVMGIKSLKEAILLNDFRKELTPEERKIIREEILKESKVIIETILNDVKIAQEEE